MSTGVVLTSVVIKTSCERLGLKVGDAAYAVIKASSVVIGIADEASTNLK
ncbi:TOBE domain-containing protein [Shewanella acanthi]|nr:TOBE domain-containing protein [Shewanella acanthi]